MKFATVEGQRREAQPNLSGTCPACERPMVSKCGDRNAWHWAHRSRRHCDPWWENETEWHRNWKGVFPVDWQEIPHAADEGERHIADVETAQGWIIEFQHSPIEPKERRARNAFYPKLVWVVDGTTRKRDEAQFLKEWEVGDAAPIGPTLPVRRFRYFACARIKEWARDELKEISGRA